MVEKGSRPRIRGYPVHLRNARSSMPWRGENHNEAKRWFKKATDQRYPFSKCILTYGCIKQSILWPSTDCS